MSGWSFARRTARRALGVGALVVSGTGTFLWLGGDPPVARGAPSPATGSSQPGEPGVAAASGSGSGQRELPIRRTLAGEGGASVEVYPPLVPREGPAPGLVVLHGMCMEPTDVCDFWPAPGRGESWVVCPRGNAVCGGAPDWAGPIPSRVDSARRSLGAVWRAHGAEIDPEKRVLIGYSRGAFLARDVLYDGHERFSGAVFLGAAVTPEPARLAAAGVTRVVLAAGDFDGARPTMLRAGEKLRAAGIPARFVSLGRMGHGLPANLADILEEPLAWVRGEPAPR